MLEGYDGDYRGVYLNAELQDDVFRQYITTDDLS